MSISTTTTATRPTTTPETDWRKVPGTVESGPSDARSRRRAGIAGLVASVAFVTTGVLTSSGTAVDEPDTASDIGRYLGDVDDNIVALGIYGLAGVILCGFYIVMSRAMTAHLGGDRPATLGTRATIWGLITLVPAYLLHLGVTGGLSVLESQSDISDATLLDMHDGALVAIAVSFAVGSLLSLGVGPLLWGLSGRANRTVATWLSRLLVVVGATGLVWAVPIEHPVVFIVTMVNVLGALVAFVALSWSLIRASH